MGSNIIDKIIMEVNSKARGRTRYEGEAPRWDEILVAEVERLRADIEQLQEELKTFNHSSGGKAVRYVTRRLTFLDAAKMATEAVKAWQEDADLQNNEAEKHECLCRADAVRQFGMDLRRAAEGVKDAAS